MMYPNGIFTKEENGHMPSIPSIKRGRINLWSRMKKAGIANAPCPSLEAPGKSINHT
jgi:hypothetical protein